MRGRFFLRFFWVVTRRTVDESPARDDGRENVARAVARAHVETSGCCDAFGAVWAPWDARARRMGEERARTAMAAGARRGRVIAPFARVLALVVMCGVANGATVMRARVPTVRGDDARCSDAWVEG